MTRKAKECRSVLKKLYEKHGVGRTTHQRLNFWESRHPYGYTMTEVKNPDEKEKVSIFESSWIDDNHPELNENN